MNMETNDAKRIFLDTSTILAMDIAPAPLHTVACTMVQQYYTQGSELWISHQVMREYLAQITNPYAFTYPLPMNRALSRVRYFQTYFFVAEEGLHTMEEFLELLEPEAVIGKNIYNATIVATMLRYNIGHVLSCYRDDFAPFAHLITVIPLVQL